MTNIEWTVETLKEHLEDLRRDDLLALQAALSAAKEAVMKSESAYDKRFEGVNEFRGLVNDLVLTLVTRNEWSAGHQALLEKVIELQRRADRQEGKGNGLNAAWGYLLGGLAVAGFIIDILFRK